MGTTNQPSRRAGLAEASAADLLLHVADAADPLYPEHMAVTRRVLHELGVGDRPELLVLNKADRLAGEAQQVLAARHPDAILLSAFDRGDIASYKEQ